MCGIGGKLRFEPGAVVERDVLVNMMGAIRHRGPDDEGLYLSGPVGLGHRRLSIIDLNTGHQPISNEDGTVWIVFNGEIYNYLELRDYLVSRGHRFKTATDTEVIIHLYEEFGPACVEKLRGMFAFAIWDDNRQQLFLARDRVGIKPLYYYHSADGIVFGSEVKAILADPQVTTEPMPELIDRFLTFYYMPGEETLFRNIRKLPPGSFLIARHGHVEVQRYWDLKFSESPDSLSLEDAKAKLLDILEDAVQSHMISDVPIGFLLSGGVDSTAMLSFAAGKTDKKISSFTVGFSDGNVPDERPYARLASERFGTEHHEITISANDFKESLSTYVWHMEEPVCEPPAIALYHVSKLARQHVKVLISGEGGDEAFAGYPDYRNLVWFERLKKVLGPFKRLAAQGLSALNIGGYSTRVDKYASLLNLPLQHYYYSRTSSPFQFFNASSGFYTPDFAACVDKARSASPALSLMTNGARDNLSRMLYVDTKTWLPDDLLIKADKMTMANSLELRVPFLDHKVLEFAASLSSNLKLRGFTTKYLAKAALHERVPKEILERKKAGFPVPYQRWLRTDLFDWIRDILLDRKTIQRGYFQRRGVETLLSKNRRDGNHSQEVFSLVVLELWHRILVENTAAT